MGSATFAHPVSLEIRGAEQFKLLEWLLTKSRKGGDAPCWLRVDDAGNVVAQVSVKDDLQAWCRLGVIYDPSDAHKGIPTTLLFSYKEMKAAVTAPAAKDCVPIAVDSEGQLWLNKEKLGPADRTLTSLAEDVFGPVATYEVAQPPFEVPTADEGHLCLTDYQQLYRYASLFATDPKAPARYALRFVWVAEGRAAGVDSLRAGVYYRSANTTERGGQTPPPMLPIPVHRGVFAAEKLRSKTVWVFSGAEHGAASFSKELDKGYCWEHPEGDFSTEFEAIDALMAAGRAASAVSEGSRRAFTVSVPALKAALKTVKKKYEEPLVCFVGPLCRFTEGKGAGLSVYEGKPPDTHVGVDITNGPDEPLYFYLDHMADLVEAVCTDYLELVWSEATGKAVGTPLYVREGKHFEHVMMPCTTVSTPKGEIAP